MRCELKTYQDLLECGNDEAARIDFIEAAITDHKSSFIYKTAVDAQLYYHGENPTISFYEKVIRDLNGNAHKNMFAANHKIASRFFGFVVDQAVSYLLGNGVTFSNPDTKEKLGKNFDQRMCKAMICAMNGGVVFGFWNMDHVEVFKITEFVPLYDEENGALMAGIRWWQIADDKPLRCTLYEIDGFTEFIKQKGSDLSLMQPKRPYKVYSTTSEFGTTQIYNGENYPTFPIVPLKNNDECKSELCGRRNTIDALDLACSNMVNDVDEGNLVYWLMVGYGGMSASDYAKAIDQIYMTHVVSTDDENTKIEPHTIEAPFDGTQATIDMLEKKLYQDFQAFDASAVTAGNQTATAIKASYVPLDLKMDKFEGQMTEFINGILALAGIDDEPTYTRNRIINTQEEIQSILMVAPYVTSEYITRKLLTIMGDADQVDAILDALDDENMSRFGGSDNSDDKDNVPTTDEAIDAAEETVGKTLNGSQTASLITIINNLSNGKITEGQAVKILMTSIGVSRKEALAIIRGKVDDDVA